MKRTSFCALPIVSTPCRNLPMDQLEVWYLHNSNSLIVIFSRISWYGFLLYSSAWLIEVVPGQRKRRTSLSDVIVISRQEDKH